MKLKIDIALKENEQLLIRLANLKVGKSCEYWLKYISNEGLYECQICNKTFKYFSDIISEHAENHIRKLKVFE